MFEPLRRLALTSPIKVNVIDRKQKGYYLRWKDPVTGKTSEEKAIDCTSLRAAKRAAEEKADALTVWVANRPLSATWDEFCKVFESDYLTHTSYKHQMKWKKVASKFAEFAEAEEISELALEHITKDRLSKFETFLRRSMAAGSINSNINTLRSGLSWAVEMDLMEAVPPRPRRSRESKIDAEMRGRPLSDSEFKKLLSCASEVVGQNNAIYAQRIMIGMWLTGMRVSEIFDLWWDGDGHRVIDVELKKPKFRIVHTQKSRRDQILPMTPDASEFLLSLAPKDLKGRVFPMFGPRGELTSIHSVVKTIRKIGIKSKIVTDPDTGSHASSHDLRRSFGTRMSRIVMPPVLMELMRHKSISTTMKYYVGASASEQSKELARIWSERGSGEVESVRNIIDQIEK